MISKKAIIEKLKTCSKNDYGIIETALAVFDYVVLYNDDGIAVDIVKTISK